MGKVFLPCPLVQTAYWFGLAAQLGATSTVHTAKQLARGLGSASWLIRLFGGKPQIDNLRRNRVQPL